MKEPSQQRQHKHHHHDHHHHHILVPAEEGREEAAQAAQAAGEAHVPWALVRCACCAAACAAAAWAGVVALVGVLLARADVPAVRGACPGFWDFVLVSLLSPALVGAGYFAVSCLGTVPWRAFLGTCAVGLAVASVYMTATATAAPGCAGALRDSAPPVPWLLVVGWLMAAAHAAAAVSAVAPRQP